MTNDATFDRGCVVWHDGLFKTSARPWFALSNDDHPFHGEDYLVAGITTTEREPAVELSADSWAVGGLPETSYVSPWFLSTLKHADIDQGVGQVTDDVCATVLESVRGYLS
jgi:mRNA-degrading endonuclease toxin of MazEF toxin-antitoxin module